MTKRSLDRAFTLAEVLITLGVIGIVAALTIPVLVNYALEREAVSKAKETYAILSQAIEQWQKEGECVGNSASCPEIGPSVWPGGAYPHQAGIIAKELAQYLKVSESAEKNGSWQWGSVPKDWMPEESYGLDGHKCGVGCSDYDTGLFVNQAAVSTGYYFLLTNGSVINITGGSWQYNIVFDINGPKKPNRTGKDVFIMSLYTPNHTSANPYNINAGAGWNPFYGVCVDTASVICNSDDGASPLAYVLAHDKLPNLKAMGYPTVP